MKEVFEIIDRLVIPLNRSELTAEFKKVDRDQDGLVSYEELLGVVVHHGPAVILTIHNQRQNP